MHFVGNVEGGDLFSGKVDVIVCDGFVGNIALKICEGLAMEIVKFCARPTRVRWRRSWVIFFPREHLKGIKKTMDYTEYGGAPLLGVRGVCVIGHGRSNANAIKNAIRVAAGLAARAGERKNRTGALPAATHTRDAPERGATMGKVAFVFPGQASQYPGMGKELAEKYPAARAVFDEADKALGFSISKICFEGTEDDLKLTANTQPAILTCFRCGVFASSLKKRIAPDFVAGHSLGEYSALVAAGSLKFADAVQLVRKRGTYMQEAVPAGQGAMAAIMGFLPRWLRTLASAPPKAKFAPPPI